MPLYEYHCEACGANEEKLQSFSAPTVHDCPKCGVALAMERQISKTAFVLSGSGWYAGGYGEGTPIDPKAAKPLAESAGGAGEAASAPVAETADTADTKAACATGCACHSPKVQELTKPS